MIMHRRCPPCQGEMLRLCAAEGPRWGGKLSGSKELPRAITHDELRIELLCFFDFFIERERQCHVALGLDLAGGKGHEGVDLFGDDALKGLVGHGDKNVGTVMLDGLDDLWRAAKHEE